MSRVTRHLGRSAALVVARARDVWRQGREHEPHVEHSHHVYDRPWQIQLTGEVYAVALWQQAGRRPQHHGDASVRMTPARQEHHLGQGACFAGRRTTHERHRGPRDEVANQRPFTTTTQASIAGPHASEICSGTRTRNCSCRATSFYRAEGEAPRG